jgi:electron transfer flavoprotein alpha subunit
MPDPSGVLIVAEVSENTTLPSITRELLGVGKKLATDLGEPLSALIVGSGLDGAAQEVAAHGADSVYVADDPQLKEFQSDAYTHVITEACKELNPTILLMGKTDVGRDLAPRVAFRLGTGLAVDCLDVRIQKESKTLVAERPVYGGNARAVVVCDQGRPQIATIRPKVFPPAEKSASVSGAVSKLSVQVDPSIMKAKLLQRNTAAQTEGVRLEDASIVIGGGRGLGGPEPFKMLEELASLVKGAVGASRAVTDSGWVPYSYQIGLTGKTITPDLYITVAISGASQHMAGCSGAKNLVAINNDSNAPIFKEAQFGVVGDWKQVLPSFIETVRELVKS